MGKGVFDKYGQPAPQKFENMIRKLDSVDLQTACMDLLSGGRVTSQPGKVEIAHVPSDSDVAILTIVDARDREGGIGVFYLRLLTVDEYGRWEADCDGKGLAARVPHDWCGGDAEQASAIWELFNCVVVTMRYG